MSYDPLAALKKFNPSLVKKMMTNNQTAFAEGEIPIKIKYLIAMALDACEGSVNGVTSLARQALQNGATEKEIAEVLEILHHICGAGSIYAASNGLNALIESH
ncbi:MAG: carboxymuconolactone decarboxylase family protein [Candidatus Marinimicrobia bacterium]|nr:carboxymuconolactone decarboxylase family protein [Candidatus Neomarinimicrobiota bacterium]